jgi:hypothetical protein
MKFYYLTSLQKLEITTITFVFCVFIGFLHPLLMDTPLNSQRILAFTLLFFAWYGSTLLFTNAFTYENEYKKLVNI